ncbi:hypothetical protein DRN97_02575 [Methanosarcinales archaeon]|nr:MAG: hypothetical protein DRN97_02575 [Methanosarcinales archaeon]
MIKLKSFSVENEEIVFEDERGIEHRLSFDDVDSLVKKLQELGYIDVESSLKFTRKWIVSAKSI